MAFTTISGIKIHCEIQGTGTPLLMFAPGGFGSTIYSRPSLACNGMPRITAAQY